LILVDLVYAADMNKDTGIQLSGPFKATDGSGRSHDIKAIRIFDEGYGAIDVYVDFAASVSGLHKDKSLIDGVVAQLRTVGYKGPMLTPGDPVLQEGKLMVLEAPDEFNTFAASKGWKDLAEDFGDE
jgi:hypothetical protein